MAKKKESVKKKQETEGFIVPEDLKESWQAIKDEFNRQKLKRKEVVLKENRPPVVIYSNKDYKIYCEFSKRDEHILIKHYIYTDSGLEKLAVIYAQKPTDRLFALRNKKIK